MPPPRRLQLESEVQRQPRPRHADRVSQRDRAAVDVDLVLRRSSSSRIDWITTLAKASLISTRSRSRRAQLFPLQCFDRRVGGLRLQ